MNNFFKFLIFISFLLLSLTFGFLISTKLTMEDQLQQNVDTLNAQHEEIENLSLGQDVIKRWVIDEAPNIIESREEGYRGKYEPKKWESVAIYDPNSFIRSTSKPVGELEFIYDGVPRTCTGTILSTTEVVTAGHCLKPPEKAESDLQEIRLTLGKILSDTNIESRTPEYMASIDTFLLKNEPKEILTNTDLDYMLLEFSEPLTETQFSKWGSAEISISPLSTDKKGLSPLFVVHHPEGKHQKITRFRCHTGSHENDSARKLILHTCDTHKGSSGAPLFDMAGKMVGIHKGEAILRVPVDNKTISTAADKELREYRSGINEFSALREIYSQSKYLKSSPMQSYDIDVDLQERLDGFDEQIWTSQVELSKEKVELKSFEKSIAKNLVTINVDGRVICNALAINPVKIFIFDSCANGPRLKPSFMLIPTFDRDHFRIGMPLIRPEHIDSEPPPPAIPYLVNTGIVNSFEELEIRKDIIKADEKIWLVYRKDNLEPVKLFPCKVISHSGMPADARPPFYTDLTFSCEGTIDRDKYTAGPTLGAALVDEKGLLVGINYGFGIVDGRPVEFGITLYDDLLNKIRVVKNR